MADDEKTTVESGDKAEAELPKAPSPLKKYGIYAGIVIVMVLAAYFVTLKVVKPMFASSETTEAVSDDAQHEEEAAHEEDSGHGDEATTEGHGESDKKGEQTSNVYMIKELIVNPAGTGGTRFLSASIGLEVSSSASFRKLNEKEPIVRDALITILSSQSIPELSDFKQREKLRKLIQLRVQKLLNNNDPKAVYFTEFVLQ